MTTPKSTLIPHLCGCGSPTAYFHPSLSDNGRQLVGPWAVCAICGTAYPAADPDSVRRDSNETS
jgi:hypothetical protein